MRSYALGSSLRSCATVSLATFFASRFIHLPCADGLDGITPSDISQLVGSPRPSFAHLRNLHLNFTSTPFAPVNQETVLNFLKACSKVENLILMCSIWNVEAVRSPSSANDRSSIILLSLDLSEQTWLLTAVAKRLPRLTTFTFDHSWEKPCDFTFPVPDGRTIRTERHGDFRVISTSSSTMEGEMLKGWRSAQGFGEATVVLKTPY